MEIPFAEAGQRSLLLELEGARRGSFAEALSPAWVVVREGVVDAVCAAAPDSVPDLPVVRGGWVMEPLADAHVHLGLSGGYGGAENARVRALSSAGQVQRILELLEAYRTLGIAAVRDGGDRSGAVLAAARIANPRPERYCAVLPAGEPVFRRGGYGNFLGAGVEDLDAAVRLLTRNREAGATHAKILATGLNSLDRPGEVGAAQFSREELRRLVATARALGLGTMVHANGALGDVLAAEPDSIEHGFYTAEGDLERLESGTPLWVPTLGAWAELAGNPFLDTKQLGVVAATLRRHEGDVARAHAGGATIAAGSDAGSPGVSHGQGAHGEIRRLVAAGVPPAAALACGCWTSRRFCERALGRPLGGLEVGGPAGFIWLDADPVTDPSASARPLGVFLGGLWSPGIRASSHQTVAY